MNTERGKAESAILVVTDTEDADGSTWRAVVVYADGSLSVQGFDTGRSVQRRFGVEEHEFARNLSRAEADRVRVLFGLRAGEDLLAEIGRRFPSTTAFEEYLESHGVPGTLDDAKR